MELNLRNEKNIELSKRLEILANYDTLTGLPNRRLFFKEIDSAIEACKISHTGFAILFIDLDGFKKVNDTFGHDIGDRLLQRCAEIFKSIVRDEDVVGRFGGDEFVILLKRFEAPYLENFVKQLKYILSKPIDIDENSCVIGLSLGMSKCPENGSSRNELIKFADSAMYAEKIKNRSV
ncbi:MAG: hypothetical protein PWQ12_493 [Clostridiales bacterium]|nr:hypothetical protein [Clostridiales bacterium]